MNLPRTFLGSLARLLFSTALVVASTAATRAATIGVNFAPVASGQTLPSGTSAGVEPQINWQNITATTNSTTIASTILNDHTGAATTASLSVSGTSLGLGWYSGTVSGGDERLMGTNLSSNSTMTLVVNSIPYANYDLIIYNLPLFSNVSYTYALAGGDTYYGRSPAAGPTSAGYVDNNGGTPFNYLEATSTNSGSPTVNATYTRYENLSGSSITFTITGGNGIAYTNGFQIIEIVPEPSRAVLLLGGLLAVGVRRRRNRR